MSALRLSTRYAKAIISLAQEQNKLDVIYKDMEFLTESIAAVRELELVFKSPVIKSDKKQKIFNEIFSGKIDKLTENFIEIMTRKGREAYLVDVAKAYISQYNDINKITPVIIKSATGLGDEIVDELLSKLRELTKLEKTTVEQEVDPSLIGGFVLRYEDKLYDASLSGKINDIKLLFDNKEFIKTL